MSRNTLHIVLKVVVNICRFMLAATFLFSGFVKANDPLGTVYKLEDYFSAWGITGIPLLMESARIMGLQPVNNFLTQNSRMHEAHIRNMESVNTLGNVNYDDNLFSTITNSRDNSRTNNAVNYAPAINITVNSGNSENDDTLAQKIADAVKNALAEIQSLNERVVYA